MPTFDMLPDFRRKVPEPDGLPVAKHKGVFQCMLQFSHIAGPSVVHESAEHLAGYAFDTLFKLLAEEPAEMVRQQGQVLDPVAQSRHGDLHHLQAVVEIFPEFALPDLLFKIFIGRGDDTHIHFFLESIRRPAQTPSLGARAAA